MKKYKIFIACDSANLTKIKEIISKTQTTKLKIGYKFGLEFLNSKEGRSFIAKIKNNDCNKAFFIERRIIHLYYWFST